MKAWTDGARTLIMAVMIMTLAYQLNLKHYEEVITMLPNAPEAGIYVREMILVSIGAVLEGSIFGDHCSPISDTTIMSSMASGSDHIDHVKTQAPYAILVGLVAIIFCYIPAVGYSSWLTIPISMLVLTAFIFGFGKKAEDHDRKNDTSPDFFYDQKA